MTSRSGKGKDGPEIVLVIAALAAPTLLMIGLRESAPGWLGTVVGLATLPLAALLSWLLIRRDRRLPRGAGLTRPGSWRATWAFGVLAGLGVLLAAVGVITPVVTALFGRGIDPEMLDPLRGDVAALLTNVLLVSWLHAALCEELIFRGFLLQRLEQVLGGSGGATIGAVLLQATLFGLAHYPQGVSGVVATALGGCLWGGIFLWSRRNLWVVIIGHATVDTILFVLVFLGLHRLVLPG